MDDTTRHESVKWNKSSTLYWRVLLRLFVIVLQTPHLSNNNFTFYLPIPIIEFEQGVVRIETHLIHFKYSLETDWIISTLSYIRAEHSRILSNQFEGFSLFLFFYHYFSFVCVYVGKYNIETREVYEFWMTIWNENVRKLLCGNIVEVDTFLCVNILLYKLW